MIQRWGMSIPICGRVKGQKATIVFGFGWVTQLMVGFRVEYIEAPSMALSHMVLCQVSQERGSLVESSGGVYVVERIAPY